MDGHASGSLCLELHCPGGFRTHKNSAPTRDTLRFVTTYGAAMGAYTLRQYEAIINGRDVEINGMTIRRIRV